MISVLRKIFTLKISREFGEAKQMISTAQPFRYKSTIIGENRREALRPQMSDAKGQESDPKPKYYKLKKNCENSDVIEDLVKILQRGGVVGIPTDTLYGIACLAQSTEAVDKIYSIKGRDPKKPIAICVGEVYDVAQWGKLPSNLGQTGADRGVKKNSVELLKDVLPGPVTIVIDRTPSLNTRLNPETNMVGVRVPQHEFVRNLASRLMEPLALTSANLSSTRSSLCVKDFENLHHLLDAVVDGGPIGEEGALGGAGDARLGSTVTRIMPDGKSFQVLRAGCAYQQTVDVFVKSWGLTQI